MHITATAKTGSAGQIVQSSCDVKLICNTDQSMEAESVPYQDVTLRAFTELIITVIYSLIDVFECIFN